MRPSNRSQFKSFTTIYTTVAVFIVGFGLATQNYSVISVGALTFLLGLCRSFSWWSRTTVALGRGNLIFGWVLTIFLVGLQIYGLVTDRFGISPLIISLIALMVVTTTDAMSILKNSVQDARY